MIALVCFMWSVLNAPFKSKTWLEWENAALQPSGRFMNIGLHPHVIDQPFRIRALRDFVAYARQFDDVWLAMREEIAEWYLLNHNNHIA